MTTLYFPPINKLGNISFRRLCKKFGADYVFTEMIRGEKIIDEEDYQLKKLEVPEDMQDITIVQIICDDIENIEKSVDKVMQVNPFTFEINYNMGCPQSSLCQNESGGGIVANPDKVEEVAKKLHNACKKHNITASIKIRLGLKREDITIYQNIERIKKAGIKKIYIHGRTLDDTYNKPATYAEIKKVVEENRDLEIIANGDVVDSISYNNIINTGCSGVLIGRSAMQNPTIFEKLKQGKFERPKSGEDIKTRKNMILDFLEFAKQDKTSLSSIKANLAYISKGLIGAAEVRAKINDINNIDGIIEVFNLL